jgi:phage replication O-like protein O
MILPMNYTQVSNDFIALLPELTGEEVKIFLAISRKTIGWHKTSDRISYSQLKALTGIRHNVTLKKAALHLVDLGLVAISGDDTKGYVYDLAISPDDTGTISRRDTTKETQDKKEPKIPLSEVEPPPGDSSSPLPFDLAKIAERASKMDAAIQVVFDKEYPGILDADFKAAMAPRELFEEFKAHPVDLDPRGMAGCSPMPAEMLDAGPMIDMSAEAAPAPPDPRKALEKALMAKFEGIQPDGRFPSQNYAKEWKGVKRLVTEAMVRQPDNPEAWLGGYFAAWKRLQKDRKTLIHGQPDTPSKMAAGGFVDYVVAEMAQGNLIDDGVNYEEIPF